MSCLFDSLAALLVERPELLASSAFVELRELREPRALREPNGESVRAAICALLARRAIEVHGIALDEWGAMEARRVRARHARRRHVGRRGRDRGSGDCAARADRGPLRPDARGVRARWGRKSQRIRWSQRFQWASRALWALWAVRAVRARCFG